MRPGVSDELAGGLAFVAAEIVGDHDVAGGEGRHKALADPGGEAVTVDRSVEDERGYDTVVAEASEKGQSLPAPVRNMCDQSTAPRGPAAGPGHVGLHPPSAGQLIPRINRFSRLDIQKYQSLGVKPMLVQLPPGAEPRHLRAQLFAGHQRFS